MIYLYERNKTGICVNRVFGYDRIVEIPDTLNGFPVTELGAYIFSDHIDVSELNKKKETGTYCTENGTEETPADDMPQAAGNQVEEICLPRFLRKIGRYAFYNDFLTELPETLRVDMKTDGELGRFWFPEFFEEGVENTPARILENHVHGSGIRYRNSFVNKKLHTLEYDKLFPYAVAWEQERIVLNLALDRILYPMSMTGEAREKYLIYIKEHSQQAVALLGEKKEYEAMQNILKEIAPDRETTEKMLETAQSSGDSRWVSILMNELGRHGRKQRKAFEL